MRTTVYALDPETERGGKLYVELVEECPLQIYVNGHLHKVLPRTPGEDEDLVVGFLFTEGLISERDDIVSIKTDGKTVDVKIRERNRKPPLSTTKAPALPVIKAKSMLKCMKTMESLQEMRLKTRASHGAMLFSKDLEPISMAEDVGRHNALDKAIGKALRNGKIRDVFLATLSSRISFEIIKKLITTNVKVVFALSRPTSKAVILGRRSGIVVASLERKSKIILYSGSEMVEP